MTSRVVTYILAGALALTLGVVISRYWYFADKAVSTQAELKSVIDQPLVDLSGNTRRLREWEGKVLLVNFWATWCAPCLEEIPLIQQARARYRHRDFEVIGVAVDEPQPVREYRDALAIRYPLLLVEQDPLSFLSRFGDEQGVLPYSAVVAKTGEILVTHTGPLTSEALERLIQSHL